MKFFSFNNIVLLKKTIKIYIIYNIDQYINYSMNLKSKFFLYPICLKLGVHFEFYIVIKKMISSIGFNDKCVSFTNTPY